MAEGSARDRRRHPRVEVLLKIEYIEPADLLGDYITNLGAGGIFVRTSVALARGSELRFLLSFPGLLPSLELRGVVRWRQQASAGEDSGLGVEFVFSDNAERQQVNDLLESLQRAASDLAPEYFGVLLVEDNEFARELFTFAVGDMQRVGMPAPLRIFAASDGREAIELLTSASVDLVIVDHYLPGMTGCELVRKMRSEPRTAHVPIIMVSVGGEQIKQEALASGVDLYLDKPVLRRQLVETLCTLLSRQTVVGEA